MIYIFNLNIILWKAERSNRKWPQLRLPSAEEEAAMEQYAVATNIQCNQNFDINHNKSDIEIGELTIQI